MAGVNFSLDRLSFTYRGSRADALSQVSASFTAPVVAILGPNGAGKSTLLRILATQTTAGGGLFSVDGQPVVPGAALADHRRRLGWMPQSLGMFGGYTCAEFLRYVAWMREVPTGRLESAVDEALEKVHLNNRRDTRIHALSGGMRQRVGLAQAVVNKPTMLILDEPTVGLDPRERAEFRAYLRVLSSGCQVVLSTHLVDDVAAVADEVLVLDQGRVRFAGTLAIMCGSREKSRLTATDVEDAYLRLVPATKDQ